MEAIAYFLAALMGWFFSIVVYHLATALVAASLGIRTREIGIGFGPTVFKRVGRHWTFRVGVLPLGGYTQFAEPDLVDQDDNLPRDPPDHETGFYSGATPLAQMLTALSGPLSVMILGILCLAAPIALGARQLQACSPAESTVKPCGVPGLTLQGAPTSWRGQALLFRDTAVEFTIRLLTFRPLAGWGGPIAFFATFGSVGVLSLAAWLTCIGVLLLWMGAANLLPVPCLNGFMLLLAIGRWITGRKLPERLHLRATIAGLVALLVLYGRAALLDLVWLWTAWAG